MCFADWLDWMFPRLDKPWFTDLNHDQPTDLRWFPIYISQVFNGFYQMDLIKLRKTMENHHVSHLFSQNFSRFPQDLSQEFRPSTGFAAAAPGPPALRPRGATSWRCGVWGRWTPGTMGIMGRWGRKWWRKWWAIFDTSIRWKIAIVLNYYYGFQWISMDCNGFRCRWLVWDNLNGKPCFFSHQVRGFPVDFPKKNQSDGNGYLVYTSKRWLYLDDDSRIF